MCSYCFVVQTPLRLSRVLALVRNANVAVAVAATSKAALTADIDGRDLRTARQLQKKLSRHTIISSVYFMCILCRFVARVGALFK